MMLEFELNMRLKQMELQQQAQTESMKIQMGAAAAGPQNSIASPPKNPKPKKPFESAKNDTLEGGQISANQFEPK